MITAKLKMRYGPRVMRKTLAWYIAGSDPAVWLDEVTSWNVAQATIRLLPVPLSTSKREPCGAVVFLTDASPPSNASHRCVPYGKVADRLYLPVDGWLDPDVSNAELSSLFLERHTYVWHPASGLVAFEPGDILGISDLLNFDRPLSSQWNRAQPGVAISRRLISLVPETTPTIEMILEKGQDDIGMDNDALSELHPSPLEPNDDWKSTASRHGKRVLASMVRWITQRVPATSDEPTWINRFEQWAEQQLANFYSGLDAARHKEILRLMHLLETDPDRGLRFALAIGGDAHRGRAAPGNRLVERQSNFDLDRLGGGRSTDYWNLSSDYQYRLTARYRELANREIQLGRFRRAAYIFAELLSDFDAAAGALVEGRHWREAAVLYRKRLNRPMDAARCLEQGGLWTEAIALYRELEEYEKAGDLHRRLEQVDSAHQQYRKAVNKHRSNGDRLSAANLLETKLNSVDEAIDELSAGWPHSSQACQCLREVFHILGRLGRHESTHQRITKFRDSPLPKKNRIELVNILADTATRYPDRTVQATAADCTRVLVSRQLSGASISDSRQFLSAVSRLVPEDRLLGRDCQRYLQQKTTIPTARTPKPSRRKRSLRLVHTIHLPGMGVSWKAATWSGKQLFVAGHSDSELYLNRCSWAEPDRPGKTWRTDPGLTESPIILAVDPQSDKFILVHVVGGPILTTEHVFQPSSECPIATRAGSIRGMSPGVVAAARTVHGITWLLESRGGHLTLVAVGPHGEQMSTQTVPMPEPSLDFEDTPSVLPVPLHARGDRVYVGVVNKMLVFMKAIPIDTVEFAQRITSLVGSAPNTRTRIAATFARGGTVLWHDLEGVHMEPFAGDVPYPVVCFNRGGYLIVASEGCCQVYSTQGRRVQFEAELTNSNSKPIAVLSAPRTDQFGIVSEAGEISVYELP